MAIRRPTWLATCFLAASLAPLSACPSVEGLFEEHSAGARAKLAALDAILARVEADRTDAPALTDVPARTGEPLVLVDYLGADQHGNTGLLADPAPDEPAPDGYVVSGWMDDVMRLLEGGVRYAERGGGNPITRTRQAFERLAEVRFVVIPHVTKHLAPALGEYSFTGGVTVAEVAIYRVEDQTLLGKTQVIAGSSREVSGWGGKVKQQDLDSDLSVNLRKAIEAVLAGRPNPPLARPAPSGWRSVPVDDGAATP